VNKKTLLVVALLSTLLFTGVAGTQVVNLAKAIPPEIKYETPPIISLHSPMNNDTFSVNTVLLSFTVTKPDNWLIHGGYDAQQIFKSINYELDGNFSEPVIVNSALESPFDYSVKLANLTDGMHALKVYAYASGWVIQMNGFYEYEIPINSSSKTVYFNVDTTSPTISLLSLANQTFYTLDVPLSFTVNEPTTQIKYNLDGQDNVTIAGNITLTNLSYGEHNITLFVSDELGNTGASETVYFSVEAPQPEPKPEPFPTALVIASVITVSVVGIGLLVYFKKRKR
jgi:FlaG/FlaF family flagellin (archaellin)